MLQNGQFAEYTGGEYCAVKHNGAWHRGKVLNTNIFTKEHTVLLVDHGSQVTTGEVAELPPAFYDIPAQVTYFLSVMRLINNDPIIQFLLKSPGQNPPYPKFRLTGVARVTGVISD